MALSPDGKTLFVACANSTQVSVLDAAERQGAGDDQLRPLSRRPVGQHAEQPVPDARRPDAVRRQRRRQQPRRLQRRRAGQGRSRSASSRPAGIPPRCATTRPTSGSTSPTARGSRSQANPQGPSPYCRRELSRSTSTSPACCSGTLSIIDLPDAGADGRRTASRPTRAARCAPTSASTGELAGGQPDPAQGRRRQPDQALHLHHQGEPHLRSGLRRHEGGQRRSEPVPLRREGHAEPSQAGPAVRAARQLLRATAKCRPTATSGRWAPTPPISWRRSGR